MSEEQDRIRRLPAWAQNHIAQLEKRDKPLLDEATRLRAKIGQLEESKRRMQGRIDAMVEMFQCAAKGENEIAKAVQRIVEDFLIPEEKDTH